jgi:hypothetical protein
MEKVCKNSIRFAPEDISVLGRSPIYIDTAKLPILGIDPDKGFIMTVEPYTEKERSKNP